MKDERGVIIGLTGGIASGKTTVSGMLRELGACVLDADAYSRDALRPGAACCARVVDTFGCQIVGDDGTISRKALAGLVFADAELLRQLNAIIHPYVLERMRAETEAAFASGAPAVVWDVPLLLEVGWQRYTDCVVVITADESTRISRIVKRDGCTREEAEQRVRAQMPDAEKCALANFVIVNQSSRERLRERVEQVYRGVCAGQREGK